MKFKAKYLRKTCFGFMWLYFFYPKKISLPKFIFDLNYLFYSYWKVTLVEYSQMLMINFIKSYYHTNICLCY